MTEKCTATVSYDGGWHFRKCGRPAKWLVNGQPRCGRCAMSKRDRAIRIPIDKAEAAKDMNREGGE